MPQSSAGEQLTGTGLVHHADPSGVSQPRRVIMVRGCSIGVLLTSATFCKADCSHTKLSVFRINGIIMICTIIGGVKSL